MSDDPGTAQDPEALTRPFVPVEVDDERAETVVEGSAVAPERTRLIAPTDRYREPAETEPAAGHRAASPAGAAGPAELTVPPMGGADPRASHSALTASTSRGHLVVGRDRELERQEHLATHTRMKRLMPLAAVLWVGFLFVDWVLATWVVPGSLWPYVGLRGLGLLPILGAWWRLNRKPVPSRRALAAIDLTLTTSCATVLALMCLLSGGLTSPYATYIAMVIAGRAAAWPDHYRTGMVRLGVPALASPVVLALAMPWSEPLRAQLFDSTARGTYFFYAMLI
ncbi:MAG: hypothetical protein K0V04_26840, partial [Deltaproteobacteria bacterium]|nr:hypothetical protein [Deltaproteobacteria bacterium]